MPHLSRPLRLRALAVATGAAILVPAHAAAAAPGSQVMRALRQQAPAVVDQALAPEQRDAPPAEVLTEAELRPAPIATVGDVALLDVSRASLAIGFHEGATRSLALQPVLDVPKGTPEPVVMPSRGRGTGPTTAVDVAVPADATITAPVSGEVVEANQYALYGATTDFLITIAPQDAPHLRIRLFHLEEPQVAVGDAVVAGETVVAKRSRQLSVNSQVDRITGERTPHVHVQVDRA